MKNNIIIFILFFTINILSAQNDIVKKEIEIEAKNHLYKLSNGNIKAYNKKYMHVDGGRNKDESIDLKYEKKHQLKHSLPKDSTIIRERIEILNYVEIINISPSTVMVLNFKKTTI